MNSSVRKGRLEPWCPITQLEHSDCDSISLPIFGRVIDRPARVADKYTLLNVSNNIFVGKHPFTRLTIVSSIKFFAPGPMLFGNGMRGNGERVERRSTRKDVTELRDFNEISPHPTLILLRNDDWLWSLSSELIKRKRLDVSEEDTNRKFNKNSHRFVRDRILKGHCCHNSGGRIF